MLSSGGLRTCLAAQQLLTYCRRCSTTVDDKSQHPFQTSVDPACVSHHAKLSDEWWNETGYMKALHSMNTLRVPFVREGLFSHGSANKLKRNTPKPLDGVSIIDVGCGGGLLSEPLARIGASVLGIDASAELIAVAQEHAKLDQSLTNLTYSNVTVEILSQEMPEQFDAVVSSEVIEHIPDKKFFLDHCIKLLKPKGSFFISTLNRTSLSWLGAIIAAENVLQIVPQGTHNWDQFITPQELQIILERQGCSTRMIHGMCYNPLTDEWNWSKNTSINYVLHAVKLI